MRQPVGDPAPLPYRASCGLIELPLRVLAQIVRNTLNNCLPSLSHSFLLSFSLCVCHPFALLLSVYFSPPSFVASQVHWTAFHPFPVTTRLNHIILDISYYMCVVWRMRNGISHFKIEQEQKNAHKYHKFALSVRSSGNTFPKHYYII